MSRKVLSEILLLAIVICCSQSCDDSTAEDNTAMLTKMSPPVDKQIAKRSKYSDPQSDLKTKLNAAISDLRKREKDDQNDLPDTPEEMIAMAVCKDENSLLDEAAVASDRQIVYLSEQLKREMTAYQLVSFPKLRQHFQRFLKEIDSHIDIDVQLSGPRNTVLTFVGAPYAPNQDTKPAMDQLNDQVKALRFKIVNFRWTLHDSHYSSYKIDSPDDDVIQ